MQNLYPTKTEAASNHSELKRTSAAQYDFYTGLVTTATDVDNNVSVVTEYDALGRPILAKAAVGTPQEVWTRMEYFDAQRRVVTKADLFVKDDGKKVAIQHFDQLGRVRLARTLEDATTEDPSNETHGIKVQTRYLTGNPNSYQITSNPYRASTPAAETDPTMGWTRSKAWNTGRKQQIETFSGGALPAPWGTNANSTGVVTTDIDAERTLVTDQAGKQRISRTNALGQLKDVWEVTAADQWTEAISFPNQTLSAAYRTSYNYDTLNNLATVSQGVQTRTFAYNSLSRLASATNPESGTINYGYDPNGNLTSKTDARGVQTDYVYDALNRVTNRNYSLTGSTPPNYQASPNVTYFYDGANIAGGTPNSKGKLTKVASSVSTTEYVTFDILGRVTRSKQITDGVTYGDDANPMTYAYNLSGALIEQTYPSGRVVKNTLSGDGDLQQVQSRKANDTFRNYANGFVYTAAGAVASMRLGNGKFESTQFNSRLQPTQIALGGSAGNTNLLKLNYDYGTTDNNGNVKSQTITVPTVGSNQGFVATQNYTYDSLNRLKSAIENITGQTPPSWKQTYTFDRYGNRRFDDANTTTIPPGCAEAVCNPQINPATNKLIGYQFDSAGNTKVDANGQTFTYDSENKQVKVQNGTQTVGEYIYDGDGRRVKKVVPNGETTIFVYDAGGKTVAEYSTVVASSQDAKVSYLTNDHLGSPRITTDSVGQVISRRDFRPYGEDITRANYGSDAVRQKFTSYERDGETSLDFAEARYHNYNLGRFSSPDPLMASARRANPQTFNRYSYVTNNPINLIDPLGMDDCDPKKDANCKVTTGDGSTAVTAPVTAPIVPGNEFISVAVTIAIGAGYAAAPVITETVPQIATQISARPLLPLLAPLAVPAGAASIILGAPLTVNPTQECGINCQEEADRTSAPAIPTTTTDQMPPPPGSRTNLFRSVTPVELADIRASGGSFNIPPGGIEGKSFSLTPDGAISYANQVQGTSLDEGPMTLVGTTIPSNLITPDMRATVDRGIPTVVVPGPLLPTLSPARILGPIPTRPR